jgi:enoyl-CoA hydratase/carnithine racemase
VRELAATIADNAPLTIYASKVAIREAMKSDADRNNGLLDSVIAACFSSEDHAEGRKAFAEKRKPVFKGK